METNGQQTPAKPDAATSGSQQNQQQQGQLRLQKIYVKDLSFETPNSPAIFLKQQEVQPHVEFNINTQPTKIQDDLYEVTMHVTITVKIGELTAFLVEVQQAGLFTLSNFPQAQEHYMLTAYCPNILFPYAREAVSDLVIRGGFPPLLLEPMNFDAMYAQHIQKSREQQKKAGNIQVSEAGHA
jgi:preprotein translocase subunit SecB